MALGGVRVVVKSIKVQVREEVFCDYWVSYNSVGF
jgi:hypothetical protein